MLKIHLLVLATASLVLNSHAAAFFADDVVGYDPGVGFVARYVSPEVALGEPSRANPFTEATDPFNPPYGTNQIVSIGAGGSITVRFQTPVLNHPNNLHGLDFTVFGGAGFIITNEFDFSTFDWIGTPATDGSLFAQSTGETRISVSRDGINFYVLNPALAPAVDHFPPTDAAGSFHVPVVPGLSASDVAGATLADIRTLYDGSAGGASCDISWAQDASGNSVSLQMIRFIRVEVLSGKAEIDGFSVIARNPSRNGLSE
jgi:hypothetical protein